MLFPSFFYLIFTFNVLLWVMIADYVLRYVVFVYRFKMQLILLPGLIGQFWSLDILFGEIVQLALIFELPTLHHFVKFKVQHRIPKQTFTIHFAFLSISLINSIIFSFVFYYCLKQHLFVILAFF